MSMLFLHLQKKPIYNRINNMILYLPQSHGFRFGGSQSETKVHSLLQRTKVMKQD